MSTLTKIRSRNGAIPASELAHLEFKPAESFDALTGYPGYQISTLGNCKSLRRGTKKHDIILKPYLRNGTLVVRPLGPDGRQHDVYLSEAVLTHFVSPRPEGADIGYMDGNTTNCKLSNLFWDTHEMPSQSASPITTTPETGLVKRWTTYAFRDGEQDGFDVTVSPDGTLDIPKISTEQVPELMMVLAQINANE